MALCGLRGCAQESCSLSQGSTNQSAGTSSVGGRVMLQRKSFFLVPVALAFLGCGVDHSEEIAALQKQVAALTRQIEEMRKQDDTLQEGQQKLRELVGTLEVEVSRLKPQIISPPTTTPQTAKERSSAAVSPPGTASASAAPGTAKVSCSQVWKLLGQGQDETTVAQTLGTTEEAVRACEQKVGRGKKRR